MKRNSFSNFAFLFMILGIVGCVTNDNTNTEIHPNDESVDYHSELYDKPCKQFVGDDAETFHTILTDLCSQELWNARDCYDACHFLMIPMHYAFKSADEQGVKAFNK